MPPRDKSRSKKKHTTYDGRSVRDEEEIAAEAEAAAAAIAAELDSNSDDEEGSQGSFEFETIHEEEEVLWKTRHPLAV